MMNTFMLVGRVKEVGEVIETTIGARVTSLIIDVERNFRNEDSSLESDDFQVSFWQGMAESVVKHAKVGALVAVKGRLSANNYTSKEGKPIYGCNLIAEKLSYLE